MSAFDPPSTLMPAQVAVAMIESGIAKHKTRGDKVFLKAVGAGVMLSFGGLLSEIVGGGSTGLTDSNPGLVKFLAGAVFPVGLIMIVLQGQELLTSNMMIFPMVCLKRVVPWWGLPWNWLLVFFGNLCGSLFFAAILTKYTGIISDEPYSSYAVDFAIHKAQEPQWYQIFLRGIGCNWLVCIAVWQAAGARDTLSKIVAVWIPIMIFVTAGFDHVIANMFSVPLGIMFGADMTAAYYIRKSLIPSFLGNIVGGCLVGLPAMYLYLGDYRADGLRNTEEGDLFNNPTEATKSSSGSGSSKIKEEAYEIAPPVN